MGEVAIGTGSAPVAVREASRSDRIGAITVLHRHQLDADCLNAYLQSMGVSTTPSVHQWNKIGSVPHGIAQIAILDQGFAPHQKIFSVIKWLRLNISTVVLLVNEHSVLDMPAFTGGVLPADLRVDGVHDVRRPLSELWSVIRTATGTSVAEQPVSPTHDWLGAGVISTPSLTARELQIARAYISEQSGTLEGIAAALGISPNTVRVHLANIRKKLPLNRAINRVSLAYFLERNGMLPPE